MNVAAGTGARLPQAGLTRRGFVLASTFAAGAWTLGPPTAQAAAASRLGVWLRFDAHGLTLLTVTTELGQGTQSVAAQVAAEELGLPLQRIQVRQAPVEPAYFGALGGYLTAGSAGFRVAWALLGRQCAAARQMLLQAAAARWSLGADACDIGDGFVFNRHDARRIPLADLLEEASALPPPENPTRKPPQAWKVLGRSVPRRDIPAKTDGSFVFGIDAAPVGPLLHAAVLHAPQFGARLLELDDAPALRVSGVRKVVRLSGSVAVVADSWWTAQQALRTLQPRWTDGPHGAWNSDEHAAALRAAAVAGAGRGFTKKTDPRIDAEACAHALRAADRVVEHAAEFPFLAHAPMEPLNATVRLASDGSAELWVSTQSQQHTQAAVAKVLGLQPAQVRLNSLPAGGGFGRRAEHDVVTEAALIAQAVGVGVAVKTIWSRETDLRSGFYRPASAVRMRLALQADGLPTALQVDMASSRIEDYSGITDEVDPEVPDATATMGWIGQSYALPVLGLSFTKLDRGVPVAYWRSVGASQNTFALETLIDLAAGKVGADPLGYRRRLLSVGAAAKQLSNRRVLALLDALAEHTGWDLPLAPGRFRGVAVNEANRAVAGHVIEIERLASKRFRIVRVVAAIDAGWVGHPDAVRAQLMGGTVWGLAGALRQSISFERGAVVQGNFDSYPLPRMADVPPIELIVLANGERPAGVGEEAVPTVAPALANALFAASGEMPTRLPLSHAHWQWLPGSAAA